MGSNKRAAMRTRGDRDGQPRKNHGGASSTRTDPFEHAERFRRSSMSPCAGPGNHSRWTAELSTERSEPDDSAYISVDLRYNDAGFAPH